MTKRYHIADAPHQRAPQDVPEPLCPPQSCGEGAVILDPVRPVPKTWSFACECGWNGPDRDTRGEARADGDEHRRNRT